MLHDWPDANASEILGNLASATQRGYSRILVHETVISSTKPHPHTTTSDLTMTMAASAMERTEQMWRELAGSAGLKVAKIWTAAGTVESVIELELP